MDSIKEWAAIVGSSLDWEQAHASLQSATKNLSRELRGRRPEHLPHSPWELVEHIRITQHDLLEFCRNSAYKEMEWPADYWPSAPEPPSEKAWSESLASIKRDGKDLAQFAVDHRDSLTEKIPHGTGQTYLRTILVAVDHTSYHVGQLVLVRRLLGVWPPE